MSRAGDASSGVLSGEGLTSLITGTKSGDYTGFGILNTSLITTTREVGGIQRFWTEPHCHFSKDGWNRRLSPSGVRHPWNWSLPQLPQSKLQQIFSWVDNNMWNGKSLDLVRCWLPLWHMALTQCFWRGRRSKSLKRRMQGRTRRTRGWTGSQRTFSRTCTLCSPWTWPTLRSMWSPTSSLS